MSPPYLFRIDEIEESRHAVHHVDGRGRWEPSTDAGANIRVAGGVSGRYWYCDRQYLRPWNQGLPPGSYLYKTCSVYYSAGHGFWILGADATNIPDGESWHPLRFEWDEQTYASHLTTAGDHHTLGTQRVDQQWPRLLLPDIYHSPTITSAQGYGGLRGELGIFLALMAHSTSREYFVNLLPTLFYQGAWMTHGYGMPRQGGRGVIVSVWTVPSNMSSGSTSGDLERYEDGVYGLYFN